jgi:predicted O-methyltransferase YrrM
MPTEILNLLARVRELNPARICEIGSYAGGTLALFAQVAPPDARLLSLDIQYLNERDWAFREFARPGQTVSTFQADSHQNETLAWVREWLGGAPLDFLFIDGDHSFAGVAQDFAMYAPLVRAGGLVAFHDIVMDNRTRHGTSTGGDVGEVPRFWGELKAKGYATEEFVENPDQDGMGIGLIHWDGKVR